jgi:hypothetical protein
MGGRKLAGAEESRKTASVGRGSKDEQSEAPRDLPHKLARTCLDFVLFGRTLLCFFSNLQCSDQRDRTALLTLWAGESSARFRDGAEPTNLWKTEEIPDLA